MIKEILTLLVDGVPTQYYIKFGKDRRRFSFHPTLKNKAAPVFVVFMRDDELRVAGDVDDLVAEQATLKVKEILSDNLFDRF
jgi:hypothetical protein